MNMRSFCLLLALIAAASPVRADIALRSFDATVQEVFTRALDGSPFGPNGPGNPLGVSEQVFRASPEVYASLSHLRGEPQALSEIGDPMGLEEMEASYRRRLIRKGVYFSPSLSRLLALAGASELWHEAQHAYDRRSPYRRRAADGGLVVVESLEGEERARRAGCLFWKAAVAANVSLGSQNWSSAFSCEEAVPGESYCRYNFAAELVVLSGRFLIIEGRGRPAVEALPPGQPGSRGTAEHFFYYCAEFERALTGNPLDLEKFKPSWNAGECLSRAWATVLAPAWRSSLELCPAFEKSGADVRQAARDLENWK